MTRHQIATALEIDTDELSDLINNRKTEAHKHYHRGMLKTETQVKKSIIKLAIAGSAPAQALADKYIEQQKNEEECRNQD